MANFTAFAARMRLDTEPAVPHVAIDNRLTATSPLEDQIARLVAGLQPIPKPAID